jgi:hypothetical protein
MSTKSTDSSTSRYTRGGFTTIQPSGRLGWWNRSVLERRRDDVEVTITAKLAGRPDLLSFQAYGTTRYMWLVLQYNNIIDINTEFVEGKTYFIPSPERVLFEFS